MCNTYLYHFIIVNIVLLTSQVIRIHAQGKLTSDLKKKSCDSYKISAFDSLLSMFLRSSKLN